MRSALEPITGVEIIGLEPDNKEFSVKYDPAKTELAKILSALDTAGEPAKKME